MFDASSQKRTFSELATDYIMPIVEPGEWACLVYIIRHGKDPATLDRLIRGDGYSDGEVYSLGTGLSRPAVKRAILGLEKKGLIINHYTCVHCSWEQAEQALTLKVKKRRKSPDCPSCGRALTKAYIRTKLTPRSLGEILTQYDSKGRKFFWDLESFSYRVDKNAPTKAVRDEEALKIEAQRLREILWYPELVDECVALAEGALKAGGKISIGRLVNGFYSPVVQLQEKYGSSPLLRYALQQSVEHRIPANPRSRNWWHYPKTICENNRTSQRFSGGKKATDTNEALARLNSPEEKQKTIEELLSRARQLNGSGEREAGRKLLSELLSPSIMEGVSSFFASDLTWTECSIREAFKQGITHFIGVDPEDSLGMDFYPEWNWPSNVLTPSQRRERDNAKNKKVAE